MKDEAARTDAVPRAGEATTNSDVRRRLEERPYTFGFFQAVRLIEQMSPHAEPVGGDTGPDGEAVRFGASPTLGFPASEIQHLDLSESPASMTVNFFGLVGPQGTLPNEYTMQVMRRLRRNPPDTAMMAFLDLFHHRATALFYRAWEKNRTHLRWERGAADARLDHALDLLGFGASSDGHRSEASARFLAYYAALLAPQPRSASALQSIITDYFEVPSRVEQFVGDWVTLESWDRTALDDESHEQNELGGGAVLGDEVWDVHAKARVRLGPVGFDRFKEFLPGGESYDALRDLLRMFSGDRVGFEVQVELDKDHVPGVVLAESDDQRLGWSTWIRSRDTDEDATEAVFPI